MNNPAGSTSLRTQLSGALIVLLLTIAAGVYYATEQELEQRLFVDIQLRGELLQTGLREALNISPSAEVASTVAAFAGEPDVERLLLVDEHGIVVASSDARLLDREAKDIMSHAQLRGTQRALNGRIRTSTLTRSYSRFEFAMPVQTPARPGELRHQNMALLLTMDASRSELELRQWANLRMALLAAAGLIVVVLFYLLADLIVLQPLRRIEQIIMRRSQGEDVRADVREPGEFGTFVSSFNALLDQNAEQGTQLRAKSDALKLSQAQYEELVTASLFGIIIHREGVPVFVNQAAVEVFSYPNADVLLALPSIDRLFELQHDELGRARIGLFGSVSAHRPWEATGRTFDGRRPQIELRARTLEWEGEDAVMLQFDDASDRHTIKQTLRDARDDALALANLRSHFLANMSHELRTPLNGVIGMLALLNESALSKDQLELIDGARRAGDALLERVNDILEFSRLEAGQLTLLPEPTDLRALIDDAFELQLVAIARKSIDVGCIVEVVQPCVVLADSSRLGQVIINLVSNAVKFTTGGHIEVRVYKDAQWLFIDVTDTGIGIAPDALERIFAPFMQADSTTTRRFGGTGLGLSICRRLMEMMGGSIDVRSQKGVGSTFSLRLPIVLLQSSDAAASSAAAPHRAEVTRRDVTKIAAICSANERRACWLANALQALGWVSINCPDARTLQQHRAQCSAFIVDEAMFDAVIVDVPQQHRSATQASADAQPGYPLILLDSAFATQAGESALSPQERARIQGVIRRPLRLDSLRQHLEPAQPQADQHHESVTTPAQRIWRALVADDVELNREVMLRMLARLGFAADAVDDGVAALDAVQRGAYDLVLMDGQMPEMDGYEATRRIRELEAPLNGIHIIAVTANAMAGDEQRCRAAGMNDYLPKPVTLRAMREVLDTFVVTRHGPVLCAPETRIARDSGRTATSA